MIDIHKITRQCIIDIKEYVPGKPIEEVKRELGLEDVIKLSSNENPLGPSNNCFYKNNCSSLGSLKG